MRVIKAFNEEFHLTIGNLEEIQEKIDLLEVTLKLLGYNVEKDFILNKGIRQLHICIFSGVNDEDARCLIEFKIKAPGGFSVEFRYFAKGDNENAEVKVNTWTHRNSNEELIEFFDKILEYL